jgi:hypothetical protein
MKITKVTRLTEKYDQYDLTTTVQNFYVRVGKKDLLIHNSPSVIFGHNPENGRFFVGTKAAFSKNPKLNYSHEDIEKHHGEHPALVEKLRAALDHLHKVAPKSGVYQGDYMYDQDSVHTHEKTHNFTPNLIQYSIPEKHEEGKKISKAKLGMVIHTKYHGSNISNMVANFEPDLHKFRQHHDVHIIPHEVGEGVHSGENQRAFETHMKHAETAHDSAPAGTFDHISQHSDNIKKYINKTVRTGTRPSVPGYRQHLMDETEKNASELKSEKGKVASHQALLGKLHHIETHHKSFDAVFRMHHHLQKAKNALVDTLAHSSPFEHTIGGKEVKPEGFVAIHKGHPIKLVDRDEFSRANLNKHST